MTNIVPIGNLGQRMVEHGRIRLGVKTGNSMKSIDTLRFTSPDREAIEQLAAQLGGTARPWSDPKASPRDQFEVITTATKVDVWVMPGGLDQAYEMWSGGGAVRRCDGEMCETSQRSYDGDYEPTFVPCLCEKAGKLECKLYTRMQLVIPTIKFGGCWRLETKGRNAAEELPAMAEMITQLQVTNLLEAELSLQKRQSQGGRRKFVVPVLSMRVTPEQLMAGGGTVVALPSAGSSPAPALGRGTQEDPPPPAPVEAVPERVPAPSPAASPWSVDDEVVDAELVDDDTQAYVESQVYELPNAPRDPVELDERQIEALLTGKAKWSASTEGRVVKA